MIINDKKIKYKNILKKLDKYKNKDFAFSSGKIIGSMCTQPHEISTKAYIKLIKNFFNFLNHQEFFNYLSIILFNNVNFRIFFFGFFLFFLSSNPIWKM